MYKRKEDGVYVMVVDNQTIYGSAVARSSLLFSLRCSIYIEKHYLMLNFLLSVNLFLVIKTKNNLQLYYP
jgi:hypothetical protein